MHSVENMHLLLLLLHPLNWIITSLAATSDTDEFGCDHPRKLFLSLAGTGELPFFDYSFRELFTTLGLENCISLFTSVLFENQILLCSQGEGRCTLVNTAPPVFVLPGKEF